MSLLMISVHCAHTRALNVTSKTKVYHKNKPFLKHIIMLYLSDGDMAELAGEREDSEELDLTERRLEQLIVGADRLVADVVVTRYAAQLRHLVCKHSARMRNFLSVCDGACVIYCFSIYLSTYMCIKISTNNSVCTQNQ